MKTPQQCIKEAFGPTLSEEIFRSATKNGMAMLLNAMKLYASEACKAQKRACLEAWECSGHDVEDQSEAIRNAPEPEQLKQTTV
jgi:hypothetical protein